MRFVIELVPVGRRVEGTVLAEEPGGTPARFSGWAELLQILAACLPASLTTPADPAAVGRPLFSLVAEEET